METKSSLQPPSRPPRIAVGISEEDAYERIVRLLRAVGERLQEKVRKVR